MPPTPTYTFLPLARQGLGIHIQEADQDPAVQLRGTIAVDLTVTGEPVPGVTAPAPVTVPKAVQLYGPGDIVGVDGRAIVRSEPRHWITNFEANHLPFVEFYDEDFIWRYTPAKPSAGSRRLTPWLTLMVLAEGEFDDAVDLTNRPLPYVQVTVDPATVLPAHDQLWAWGHVHVDEALGIDPGDVDGSARRLGEIVSANRDRAYSRLLSPRILQPNTPYHAFVIPTYESGRLAGLGLDPALAAFATQIGWPAPNGAPSPNQGTNFPFYHRWYFRTGTVGDFEYLVRLLVPKTVDPRVGRRDMDTLAPLETIPPIPDLGGILRLGGALRAPLETLSVEAREEYDAFEAWGDPYPHAFQKALASLVNLADDYGTQTPSQANAQAAGNGGLVGDVAAQDDPLIVPPLYGRWHARQHRLDALDGDPGAERWVGELNLDPRFRTAAGFGTQVVQTNQEDYMEAAWQQVGDVLEGNARIRFGQAAKVTSDVWHLRELTALNALTPERLLAVAAPVQRRILVNGVTVHRMVQRSVVPFAAVSTTMRKSVRPGARISRLVGFDQTRNRTTLLRRINAREVFAAPPKAVPAPLTTLEGLSGTLKPVSRWEWLVDLLARYPWLRWLHIVIAILFAFLLFPIGIALAAAVLAAGEWLQRRLQPVVLRTRAARLLDPANRTPAAVDALPSSPDLRIDPVPTPATIPAPRAGGDSADARRFKTALRTAYALDAVERAIERTPREPLALDALANSMLDGLRPDRTIPARVLGGIRIPGRILGDLIDPFGEVMVYPEIDEPMYFPLKEISSELFLPNIQLVEFNSITLLETNQKFIESYMVGLNHEFARELLWREYPTDQRGSYFRQFWDVSDFLAAAGTNREALRERLRDIPELHRWAPDTALGAHDHREEQGDKEEELVLVIRGELLKRYPTAVIYAHRATWERNNDGSIDQTRPRKLVDLIGPLADVPPRDIVKTPLYEAKVDPDIYFFGFDLTAEKAKGGPDPNGGEDDPGWFFVIKERPSEPRFGLDIQRETPLATLNTWNDLSLAEVTANPSTATFLRPGEKSIALVDPGAASPAEQRKQYLEDRAFQWRGDTQAAEVAYILFQLPVMMAVHAAEMLKTPS
jgi:hypothetical protein